MRKGRFLKYLLAMVVAFSTSVDVMADEVEFLFGSSTVELKKQGEIPKIVPASIPLENIVTASYLSFSSSGLTQTGNAVSNSASAKIKFQSNFKYEVNQVAIRRWTQWVGSLARLATTVKNASGTAIFSKTNELVDRNEPSYTSFFSGKTEAGLTEIEIKATSSPVILYGLKVSYTIPEIRIRFANGNKGYDVTVGDNNAQIEGYISAHPGAFEVGKDNVYFKYTSSNNAIAEIDPTTGKISAKAEGDTEIKATLIQKVGETEYDIASYDYPLHVFAPFEGLSWNSYDTWYKNSTSNNSSYKFGGEPHVNGIDWTISDKLKSQTTIWENESNTQSSGQYKQFASFEAPAPTTKYWRAAVQKLSCDILVPKYTKVESTMKFGANATLGSESKSNVTYGYELVDLGIKTDANTTFAAASAAATTRIGEITWNTASPAEDASSVSAYRTSDRGNGITYLRNGAQEYRKYNIFTGLNNGEGYVGDHYTAGAYWKYDNSKNAEPYNETRFFAAMVFLQNQVNYSATVSFGYQDIPTYEYYVYLDYYANYDDNKHLGREERSVKAKDATIHLNSGNVSFVPNRPGYRLLGWSTDRNAKTAEYPVNGAFYPYDSENGGGKGEVKLYAVWEPKTYTVTLDYEEGKDYVTATYGESMPSVDNNGEPFSVPTMSGRKFDGYYTSRYGVGEMYYTPEMASAKNWDISADATLYACWKYSVTLHHNGGTNSINTVYVRYNGDWPEAPAPIRTGYIFDGYYNRETPSLQCYDSEMHSVNKWGFRASGNIDARWIPKTTTITFDRNGAPDKMDWGGDNGTSSVTATYDQSMPQITAPQRSGYTFAGYYDHPNGQGKKYYDFRWSNVESVTSWDKDVVEATLYAYWIERDYTVEFVYPTGGNKQVTGYKTNSSNNTSLTGKGITSPTPPDGYVFAGWAENDGKGSVVYDADGNAVEGNCWQRNSNGDIVWIGGINEIVRVYPYYIKDMVTVNVTVVRDDNYENTDYNHRYVGVSVSGMADITSFTGDFSGYITVDGENFLSYLKPGQENYHYPLMSNESYPDNLTSVPLSSAPIWHFELREGATGLYNIYTVVNGQKLYLGPKVESSVTEDAISVNPFVPEFPFIIYGGGYVCYNPLDTKVFNHVLYMKDDTNWEYENTGRNPQYKPIKIIAASSTTTTYGNLNAKTVIKAIKEKLTSPEYAYNVEKANVDIKDADLCKGLLYVDMGGAAKVMETTAGELRNFKDEVSDNCLFFMPKTYNNTLGTNVVTNMGDKYVSADDLVITDKVPFSSPYTFSTGSHIASYNRVTSDKWGSMCLPFPVKRSGSDMKFYNLYGSDDLRLAFESVDGTNDIPANEPIACYGSGSFTLTSNSNAVVPADNASREYDKEVIAISCDNIRELVEDKKQMTKDSKTWNFKGVRFDSYVYGTEYTGTLPNRAKKSLVYYFSKDKFTYVNSKGRVKFAPFRAYLQAPEGSNAKTFSLLVFDEDGATDITDIIDGNAGVANGKIYDLLGRRVKTPLKGHIYIVDGKKKQY